MLTARRAAMSLVCLVLATACSRDGPDIVQGAAVPGGKGAINLEQGWSATVQEQSWFASFGSRLMPQRWLEHLEQAQNTERFVADANMQALGFLVQEPTPLNPAGFPVGFTRVSDDKGREWAGLGCAACHTGEIHFRGTRMRLDGGQALIDFERFEAAVVESLSATVADSAKFDRFATALAVSGDARQSLQNELVESAQKLDARHRLNHSDVPYGHGRLDAFGQIFNAVAVDGLGLPENRRAPDAPASFPVLWSAPHLDLVQWNASAPNAGPGPLLQNVTTALAVYGHIDMAAAPGLHGYPSTVDFSKLGDIQNFLYALKPPRWPEAILGTIDRDRAARGQAIYAAQCTSCHELADRDDPKRRLKATLVKLDEVGTDPRAIRNFLDATVSTGVLQGRKQAVLAGAPFGPRAPSIDVVVHATIGATLRHPVAAVRDAIVGHHKVIKAALDQHPDYYKARPLDGIWASAPYLHNGSVPSLAELLQAPAQRVATFYVGGREFDPATVGLETGEGPARSLFDTTLPGNWNRGHEYGTTLADEAKRDLIEYLKTL